MQSFPPQDVTSRDFASLLHVLFPHKEAGYFEKLQEKYNGRGSRLWLFTVNFNSRTHSINLVETGEPSCAVGTALRKVLGQGGTAVILVAAESIGHRL